MCGHVYVPALSHSLCSSLSLSWCLFVCVCVCVAPSLNLTDGDCCVRVCLCVVVVCMCVCVFVRNLARKPSHRQNMHTYIRTYVYVFCFFYCCFFFSCFKFFPLAVAFFRLLPSKVFRFVLKFTFYISFGSLSLSLCVFLSCPVWLQLLKFVDK